MLFSLCSGVLGHLSWTVSLPSRAATHAYHTRHRFYYRPPSETKGKSPFLIAINKPGQVEKTIPALMKVMGEVYVLHSVAQGDFSASSG